MRRRDVVLHPIEFFFGQVIAGAVAPPRLQREAGERVVIVSGEHPDPLTVPPCNRVRQDSRGVEGVAGLYLVPTDNFGGVATSGRELCPRSRAKRRRTSGFSRTSASAPDARTSPRSSACSARAPSGSASPRTATTGTALPWRRSTRSWARLDEDSSSKARAASTSLAAGTTWRTGYELTGEIGRAHV